MKIAPYALVVLALSPAAAAFPPPSVDISGTWTLTGSIGEMPVELSCVFAEVKGKLTGTCANPDIGELALTGETDGKTVTWKYEIDFDGEKLTVVYKGALESETEMKGTIAVGDEAMGSFTAKKVKRPVG